MKKGRHPEMPPLRSFHIQYQVEAEVFFRLRRIRLPQTTRPSPARISSASTFDPPDPGSPATEHPPPDEAFVRSRDPLPDPEFCASVVKDKVYIWAMALPAASLMPVSNVAIYVVLSASGTFGVKVAVFPVYVTTPATVAFVALFRVNVAVVIVDASRFSLNVAVTAVLVATPVALTAGEVAVMVGGVVSEADPVVNVQE